MWANRSPQRICSLPTRNCCRKKSSNPSSRHSSHNNHTWPKLRTRSTCTRLASTRTHSGTGLSPYKTNCPAPSRRSSSFPSRPLKTNTPSSTQFPQVRHHPLPWAPRRPNAFHQRPVRVDLPIFPPPHLPQEHPLCFSLSAGSRSPFSASSPEKKRGQVSTTRTSRKSVIENSTLPARFTPSTDQNSFFLGNLG